jgi:hypothetical protein
MRGMMVLRVVGGLCLTWAACSGTDRNANGDTDTTSGADAGEDGSADGDTDTDTDTDTDGDTDTGTGGPVIPSTCEEAASMATSVGCEFFTADLDNCGPTCDPMTYAVVVSNPQQDKDAVVTVTDGTGATLNSKTLTPNQLWVIRMTCSGGKCLAPPAEIDIQGIGLKSAFRVSSDVPILAYQWNPYGVGIQSTDASLLLPTTSLNGTYIAAAWGKGPGAIYAGLRSEIAVVITQDDTHLTFIPSVNVPDKNGVGPHAAGQETAEYVLDAYDVIELSPEFLDKDLTGTVVQADKPVVVFGGHQCANTPNGVYGYCDHVEEEMLPLTAWGTSAVLARHEPRTGCSGDKDVVIWRVIAGADAMTVTFDPPLPSFPSDPDAPPSPGASHAFAQQGDVLEFWASGDHYAEGKLDSPSDPEHPEASFFAYQLMTGSDFQQCGADTVTGFEGDPMMMLAPPAGQYLDRYVFNTDNVFDFDYDHIIVVRKAGATVELDCAGPLPASMFTPVGSTDWEAGRFFIDDPANDTGCKDGAHAIWGDAPFGLSVVGTSPANSYGYPGGLSVRNINPDPEVE